MDNNGIDAILKSIKDQVTEKENDILNSFETELQISFDDYQKKMKDSICDINTKLNTLSENLNQLESSLNCNINKLEEVSTLQKSEKQSSNKNLLIPIIVLNVLTFAGIVFLIIKSLFLS